MQTRIKPTMTVYPCRSRSSSVGSGSEHSNVWLTWEALEREHFSSEGLLVADFSRPLEVDPSMVKNHRYVPET
ncbi:hypothetical protein [Dyella acidisoli]|uniref:Uncharacterized protein n=1 Tax=Dyella acidisoli TaxID=1867834 RepID=A0ABQ5XHQ3_9GAMM|nr:hypothetical protein [Dyella acidisoli]GLQ91220.1 hypothetical protein GCM10007901_01700 [Dyella acidisoli]